MTTEPSPSKATPNPSGRRTLLKQIALWLLLGVIAVFVAGGIALVQAYRSDVVLPGVEALGVDLGRVYRFHAAEALQHAWEQQRIQVTADEYRALETPSELGLLFDAGATASAAYDLSRTRESLLGLLRRKPRLAAEPVWEVNVAAVQSYLRTVAAQIDRPPVDADIRLAGGRLEAIASRPGRELDLIGSLAWLRQNASTALTQGQWDLQVKPRQPQIADLGAAVAQANLVLQHSITFDLYDAIRDEAATVTIGPEVWSEWLDIAVDEEASIIGELNEAKVQTGLEEQMTVLGPDRMLDPELAMTAMQEAIQEGQWRVQQRVYHRDRQHAVELGETLSSIAFDVGIPYLWILRANPGMSEAIQAGQVITIPSPDIMLPLPIVAGKRITVSLSSQMMWAYEEGELKWEWPVSTGLPPSPTSPGVFQVQSHELNAYAPNWDLWMPYFLGIYRPVPDSDFENGFHGFPTRGAHQMMWTDRLGSPVTYGCIMISSENAALLYEWAENGTVVVIEP